MRRRRETRGAVDLHHSARGIATCVQLDQSVLRGSVSMNLGRGAAVAAMAATAILAGCGKSEGQRAADGASPAAAKSQAKRTADDPRFLRIDNIAEALSPEVRSQFDQLAAQQRRMQEEAAERANVHPDRLDQMAA